MANCRRCGGETDRQTLAEQPLCLDCADWYREIDTTRSVDQHALEDYEDEADESGRSSTADRLDGSAETDR